MMEQLDQETPTRPGLFTRLFSVFRSSDTLEEEADVMPSAPFAGHRQHGARYHITVRRQVLSFQDAIAAADGLKRGEQQILNLSACEPAVREKIKDFMCGVNYAQEGTWEELGEHVFLLAPAFAFVDVAPATPRMQGSRN